jgi:hypothetical protein
LLFQLRCIRIFFCSSEVVFFSHVTPFTGRLWTLSYWLCGLR